MIGRVDGQSFELPPLVLTPERDTDGILLAASFFSAVALFSGLNAGVDTIFLLRVDAGGTSGLSETSRAFSLPRTMWPRAEALPGFELFCLVLTADCNTGRGLYITSFDFVVDFFFGFSDVVILMSRVEVWAANMSSTCMVVWTWAGAREPGSVFRASRIFRSFFLIFLLGRFFLVLGGLVFCRQAETSAPPGSRSTGFDWSPPPEVQPSPNRDAISFCEINFKLLYMIERCTQRFAKNAQQDALPSRQDLHYKYS